MVKSNRYLSLRKSSALSQDKNFHDAVVASTMLRVNAGLGMWLRHSANRLILTPYRFSCCSKVFPCDKYDFHSICIPLPMLMIYIDATTRKPTTRTNTQTVWYVATAPASKSTGPRTAVSAKQSWLERLVVGSGRVERGREIGLWWVEKVCFSV